MQPKNHIFVLPALVASKQQSTFLGLNERSDEVRALEQGASQPTFAVRTAIRLAELAVKEVTSPPP